MAVLITSIHYKEWSKTRKRNKIYENWKSRHKKIIILTLHNCVYRKKTKEFIDTVLESIR